MGGPWNRALQSPGNRDGIIAATPYSGTMKVPRNQKAEEEFLAEALAEALRITDSFVAEPVFARTGQGAYKSRGVEGLKADIALLESRAAPKKSPHG